MERTPGTLNTYNPSSGTGFLQPPSGSNVKIVSLPFRVCGKPFARYVVVHTWRPSHTVPEVYMCMVLCECLSRKQGSEMTEDELAKVCLGELGLCLMTPGDYCSGDSDAIR